MQSTKDSRDAMRLDGNKALNWMFYFVRLGNTLDGGTYRASRDRAKRTDKLAHVESNHTGFKLYVVTKQ